MKNRNKIILSLIGLSLPLLNARIELSYFTVPLSTIFILLIIFNDFRSVMSLRKPYNFYIYIYVFLTLFSVIYSLNPFMALLKWIKLATVVMISIALKNIFVENPKSIDIVMWNASNALVVYLLFLSWVYILKFNQNYIGINIQFATKAGRNSLAFVTAFLLPYIIQQNFIQKEKKKTRIFDSIKLIITCLASLLIQSRALYLLIFFYFMFYFLITKVSIKKYIKGFIGLSFILFLIYIILPLQVRQSVLARMQSIIYIFGKSKYSNAELGSNSIDLRKKYINFGYRLFLNKPMLGYGLNSFQILNQGAVSHNDYIQILVEQGLVGFMTFLLSCIQVIHLAYLIMKKNLKKSWMFVTILGVCFYFSMINAFDNLLVWILIASITATYRIEMELFDLNKQGE